MKKLIVIMILIGIGMLAKAQTYMPNGMVVGAKNAGAITNQTNIKKIVTVGGYAWTINSAGDTLTMGTAVGDWEDAADIFVPLLPDTTAVKTASFTLALTDASKVIVCTKATSLIITVPTNATVAIPVGTTINFIQGGAGILVFKEGSANIYSKKDSIATGGIWSWAALYKRGTDNWILYGDIID